MTVFLITLFIVFIAALIKATLGFGDALVAMPLLTLTIGLQMATPLVALMMTSLTLLIIWHSWQRIDFSAAWRLVIAGIIGVPIGVWGLRTVPEHWMKMGLGMVLILLGLYYLFRPPLGTLRNERWAYPFGFVSGILGGAYNTGSPPVIIYGTMRHWLPEQFRASLQSCFLPLNLMILLSHALGGLWNGRVFQLFALSLPVVLLAFWLGSHINRHIPKQRFAQLVYIGLVGLGILMLIRA